MSERSVSDTGGEERLLRGVLGFVALGLALGLVYNWRGLESRPGWGVPWIAEDRLSETPSLATMGGASDDPMAIVGGGGALPAVPDLDRPIQVDLDAAKRFHDAGAGLFVDARDAAEFSAGHIAGAVNLPYDLAASEPELLDTLDAGGRPIVVYCGGGACELSLSLAYDLVYAGRSKVLVYMGGYAEWERAGYPVEIDAAEGS